MESISENKISEELINSFDENILDGKFIGMTGSSNDGTTVTVNFEFLA